MPLALLLIGILFLVAAVRGKQPELFNVVKDDFTGPNNFFYWGTALFVIGAIGYYKPMKPASNAFLTLVIIVLFFSNRGFFQKFMDQIGATRSGSSGGNFNVASILNLHFTGAGNVGNTQQALDVFNGIQAAGI